MPKLHASASWPFFNCPASKKESEKAAGSTCKPARDGQLLHMLIAKHFRGEKITWPEQMDDKQRDMKWLFDSALYIWEELSPWLRNTPILIEHQLTDDPEITGTLDYAAHHLLNPINRSIEGNEPFFIIIDWKSGYIRDIENALCQLKTYAGLLLMEWGLSGHLLPDKIYLYVGWLRDREEESDPGHPFTVEEIDAHMAILRANLQNQGVYVTGEHCASCGGKSGCPAIGENAMLPMKWASGQEVVLNAENAIKMKPFLTVLQRAVDDSKEAIRNYVEGIEEQGGKVVHDGKRLTIGPESEAKRHVDMCDLDDFLAATDQKLMTLTQSADLAVVPFGAIKEAVMNNTPRGKKGAAVKEIEALLDEKGVIVKSKRRGSLKLEKETDDV